MINVGYVITNGSKFIRMDQKNKVDSTKSFQQAKVFESRIKAVNFASCMPSSFRNAGYEVVSADFFVESQTEEDCLQQVQEHDNIQLKEINEEFLDMDYLLANVQVFEEFIREFQNQKFLIEREQTRMDRMILDLEHAAEICELDVRRGYMLYKMLHKARKRRRACKDAALICAELMTHVDQSILSGHNTKMIESFYDRKYRPREIPDLFDIFNGKKTQERELEEEPD